MIQSLLIANRGEIAVRIIRTCREMGIRTVLAHSQADTDSLPVHMADEHVCVGPAPARESYLNVRNLVTAGVLSGCDALHPGVGFLAENAGFARDVGEAGLIFVGPDPEVIELLGDKIRAKHSAKDLGIPVIPGSSGSVENARDALAAAESIGYPVIVKAAAGGGGKGMRIVRSSAELGDVLVIASQEAEKAFSDGTVYLEKYLENPRHVEIQIIADRKGGVVHLGERDCTVQQNHQKLIEESPSPVVTPDLRARMGEDAVRLLRGLGYTGAGTVEFLVLDGRHYFMEVNARVQVEHPVSEMVTGVDIIRQQLIAASDEALEITAGRGASGRLCGGMPDQRPLGGTRDPVHGSRRLRRADGHLPVRRLQRAAMVRSPGGKAHRHRADQGGGPASHAACAVGAGHRGHFRRTSSRRGRSSRIPSSCSGTYGTGFLGEVMKEGSL